MDNDLSSSMVMTLLLPPQLILNTRNSEKAKALQLTFLSLLLLPLFKAFGELS
jgi:hypothetical protein